MRWTIPLVVVSIVLTVAVAASFGPLLAVDNAVADGLHGFALGHPGFVRTMQVWTDVFQPWTFRAALAAVAGWLLWRRRPWAAGFTLGSILLCGAVEVGLKALVGRMRPHWTHPVSHAVGYSFPSGHALTSAVGCAVLLVLAWPVLKHRWAWTAVAVTVPVVTSFTRIALGVHFLSDVVGGCLIAAALTAAMTVLATPRDGPGRRSA